MQIAILGRQPKLSLAELESLFGAEKITPIGNIGAFVDEKEPLPQSRLGGTMKSAKLLTRLEKADLSDAFNYLQKMIPEHLHYLPDGKLQLGVSVYGEKAQRDWLLKQMLTLKKAVKKTGRSVRIIENKSEALESAQVLYNKLTGPLGWELLLIKDGEGFIVAQTTGVQNIDDYSKRDFDRPKRDAFVGMLPPKLAQIMINLAVGRWHMADGKTGAGPNSTHHIPPTIFDPFCGTGVVLQEAVLTGYDVIGSDLSEKMVEYSGENLDWLKNEYPAISQSFLRRQESSGKEIAEGDTKSNWIPDQAGDDKTGSIIKITQADATTHNWGLNIQDPSSKIFIVCETYLGKPLTSLPGSVELETVMNESNEIAKGFLGNISTQIKKGTRLCLALPAWHLGNGMFKHLKVLDQLTDLGYNRLDLKHATKNDLVYHRENQIVARELTILEKI